MRKLIAVAALALGLSSAAAFGQLSRDIKFDIAKIGPAQPPSMRGALLGDIEFEGPRSLSNLTLSLGPESSTFNRPMSCSSLSTAGSSVPFQAITVRNTGKEAGTLNLRFGKAGDPHAACGATPDTLIAVYEGLFVPASPLTNCVDVNDDADGASDRCSSLRGIRLPAGEARVIVLTTFSSGMATASANEVKLELSFDGSVPVTLQSFSID